MPGHARKDIVREGEIGVYHTWSRCVQRAFLCGYDPVTGQDFDYRRTWIKSLLEYLASVFAVDVGNYSILSNHQHLIARTRPDIAATWNDEQVAWRWRLAWPTFVEGQWVRQPTDEEIEEILARPERIPKLRANLASLSWFMARWKEPIAKMANRESGVKGHYYEQRFGSREFLDDPANLCGNAYLDMNQFKAGMASSLDSSTCSAICDRLLAWRQREARESLDAFRAGVPDGYELESSQMEQLLADSFLAPISDSGPGLLVPELKIVHTPELLIFYSPPATLVESQSISIEEAITEEAITSVPSRAPADGRPSTDVPSAEETRARKHKDKQKKTWRIHQRLQVHRRRRASDAPLLGIPLKQYLELMQATVEQLTSKESPDATDASVPPWVETKRDSPTNWELLKRFGIEPAQWCALINHFGDLFCWAVGTREHMAERAKRNGMRWLHGSKRCRDAFT